MGYIDWDNDGVEPHEVARTAALAHMAVEEFEGTDGPDDGHDRPSASNGSRGCSTVGVIAGAAIGILVAVSIVLHALYG